MEFYISISPNHEKIFASYSMERTVVLEHRMYTPPESPGINSPSLFFCRYLNSEDYEGGFERIDVEKMFTDIESNFRSWAESYVTLAIGVNDPISIEKFKRSFVQMRPDIALSVARLIFLSDLRDVLEKVEVPCTIIQGTNDIAVPTSVAHYMQHKMKGKAMVETVVSHGHFPQLTAHQTLIEALDRVLAAMEPQKDSKVSNEECSANSGVSG